MKKLSLAAIIVTVGISLVGCTNSGEVSTSNNASSVNSSIDSSVNNKTNTEASVQNNDQSNTQNNNQNNVPNNTQSNVNNTGGISIDEAKEISLKHAGLSSNEVTFVQAHRDLDDGIQKYDIEFYCNGKEYDYEINVTNGQIIKYDYDMEYNYIPNNNQSNVNNTTNISAERAKEISLTHAGLTNGQVAFKRTELDFDNGIKKYEVEFYYNNREYSYEIDANTGNILSYEQD